APPGTARQLRPLLFGDMNGRRHLHQGDEAFATRAPGPLVIVPRVACHRSPPLRLDGAPRTRRRARTGPERRGPSQ
ncbi:hypothetical protein EVAR_73815_1, partial [Eumeta japonica]